MANELPCATPGVSSNACTAKTCAPGAIPNSLPCATMAPAIDVPCVCGFSPPPSASKLLAIAPSRSGCFASISRIDHGNQDILSRCHLLRLRALQFRQNVLRRIALRAGGNLGGLFLQCENIVRLHVGDDAFAAERADCVGHRAAAAKAPAIEAGPDQRKTLRIELRQFVPPRDQTDRLRRCARRERGNDFVGNEILIALRRRPAAAATVVAVTAAVAGANRTAAAAADISATAAADNRRMSRWPPGPARRPADKSAAAGTRPCHWPAHHRPAAETTHVPEATHAKRRRRMRSGDTAGHQRASHRATAPESAEDLFGRKLIARMANSRCGAEPSLGRGDEAYDLIVLQRVDDARQVRLGKLGRRDPHPV